MRSGVRMVGILSMVLLFSGMMMETNSPLADAVMRGDQDAVWALIADESADVNEAQPDGMTALHWAAYRGDADVAEALLERGADVTKETRLGSYTPLHLASRSGSGAIVRLLLDAGSDPHRTTTQGDAAPLHLAAAAGDADAVAALVERGADVNVEEAQWGQTPLIFAASANRPHAIRVLLEAGADPSVTTRAIHVPDLVDLHSDARERWQEVLDEYREEADAEEDSSWTPTTKQLESAAKAAREVLRDGRTEVYSAVDTEPDPGSTNQNELVGSWGGLTALLHAARQGHTEAAMELLDGGADINQVSAGDETSPLLIAAINGQFDLALRLVERGANPNLASHSGATPLYAAIERQWTPRSRYPQVREHEYQDADHIDVMEALLEAGADPNVRLNRHLWYMSHISCGNFNCGLEIAWGATPFWRAAYGLDVPAMRLLVAYGADPNIPNRRPPERGSSYSDDEDEEEEVDPSGLPPIELGGPGVFPIHAASGVGYGQGFAGNAHSHAPRGWVPAVQFLVEEIGADVNQRDYNGFTALHHAAARGDDELVLYLVGEGADVTAVARTGQTTADMANGPVQRVTPYVETVRLLESLGSKNNDNCVSC